MFEYKFVEIPLKGGFKVKKGDNFQGCKDIINEEARSGWRLKQIVGLPADNTGMYCPYSYQIIFERKLN